MSQPVLRLSLLFLFPLGGITAAAAAAAAVPAETGHLHHVHMNVADPQRTTDFYRKYFGVVPVQYDGRTPALMTERSFLFMTRRDAATIGNHQLTGLTHVCWGNTNGQQTFEWMKSQGLQFYTPIEEFTPGTTYMYVYGPDHEVIETSDAAKHHRYNHIHLVARDAKLTAEWFRLLLGLPQPVNAGPFDSQNLSFDGVLFAVLPIGARFTPRENDGTTHPTEGTQLDHIAFSFRNLDAAYRRIKASGVAIVKPVTQDPDYGFRHFFVRAPNDVLVELVEARSWPEAAWQH